MNMASNQLSNTCFLTDRDTITCHIDPISFSAPIVSYKSNIGRILEYGALLMIAIFGIILFGFAPLAHNSWGLMNIPLYVFFIVTAITRSKNVLATLLFISIAIIKLAAIIVNMSVQTAQLFPTNVMIIYYEWYAWWDITSHYLFGIELYFYAALLLGKKPKSVIFLLSFLIGLLYEGIEWAFALIHLPIDIQILYGWTMLNTLIDLVANVVGGLIAMGIHALFATTRKMPLQLQLKQT